MVPIEGFVEFWLPCDIDRRRTINFTDSDVLSGLRLILNNLLLGASFMSCGSVLCTDGPK